VEPDDSGERRRKGGNEWRAIPADAYFRTSAHGYFDPKARGFMNCDPVGFAGGNLSLFRYIQNNPIDFENPLGLKGEILQSLQGCSFFFI